MCSNVRAARNGHAGQKATTAAREVVNVVCAQSWVALAGNETTTNMGDPQDG